MAVFEFGKPTDNFVDPSELDWGDTGITGVTETSSGGSTLSGQASLLRAQTDAAKFRAEQKAATDAFTRTQTGTQQQADYLRKLLDSGMNVGGLESQIAAQETSGRQYIEDQAKMLSDLISGRRGQAMQTTTAGYDALRNFLAANPMQAYAQAQRAVPTVQQGILDQYMASRGISAAPAQAGQDVVNAQLAAQAANYNQLLNVLTGAETQQQASRAAEEQMARALAGSQLEAIYGQATSGLEQQRLAALNDLANRISAARLQNERDRIAREQALQDAIAKLLGTGLINMRPQEQGGAPTGSGSGAGNGNDNAFNQPTVPGPIFSPQDPGLIAAAEAQGVSPQLLYDLATVSGNPMFGALQDRMYMV